jgi:hypothetical protein
MAVQTAVRSFTRIVFPADGGFRIWQVSGEIVALIHNILEIVGNWGHHGSQVFLQSR